MKHLALIAATLLSNAAFGNSGTYTILDRYGAPAYYIQENGDFATILDRYGRPAGYGINSTPSPINSAPITIPGRKGTMPYQEELFENSLPDIDGRF